MRKKIWVTASINYSQSRPGRDKTKLNAFFRRRCQKDFATTEEVVQHFIDVKLLLILGRTFGAIFSGVNKNIFTGPTFCNRKTRTNEVNSPRATYHLSLYPIATKKRTREREHENFLTGPSFLKIKLLPLMTRDFFLIKKEFFLSSTTLIDNIFHWLNQWLLRKLSCFK